ncbi:hypothetical protein pEpSNUABM09_43 [Erwinia phage pEp_SNUABM_09]|uniref:Uncharacterized protein n=1 Tax=Erwinia phage pEp_SNUABM_09 TaxID=2601644 RepID=A0A5J6DAI0_9CAUD|nr:hypothetical protein pEpSNUABM09_43 [Erwinia phage pEp_SNUABM_09]
MALSKPKAIAATVATILAIIALCVGLVLLPDVFGPAIILVLVGVACCLFTRVIYGLFLGRI